MINDITIKRRDPLPYKLGKGYVPFAKPKRSTKKPLSKKPSAKTK